MDNERKREIFLENIQKNKNVLTRLKVKHFDQME